MSSRNYRITVCVALAVSLVLTGGLAADDRDFLRKVAAPPNFLFILDTSKSMVGSPEQPGVIDGARVGFGMVPGGGDDPYSRMGIAKKVLRDFLNDVSDVNFALAGYADDMPPPPPAIPGTAIPTKHWVYEARDQDHFHLIEKGYAYRMGPADTFLGEYLDNPATILQDRLIGYNPYFDPAASAVPDRYGPTTAFDTGITEVYYGKPHNLPYDLMPLHFFNNCFLDDMGTSATGDDTRICRHRVFPWYPSPSGERDPKFGYLLGEEYYYGDTREGVEKFPNCVPWITPTKLNPDDGCRTHWVEISGTDYIEHYRRVQLVMPLSNPSGDPNHPLGVDAGGAPVGNEVVADPGGDDDYDLDGDDDPDYDGDEANDWILYIDAVEWQNTRTCDDVPPTPVPPADTPIATPTGPPATPTPIPAAFDCSDITFDQLFRRWDVPLSLESEVHNNTGHDAYLTQTHIEWADTEGQPGSPYIDRLVLNANLGACDGNYWNDNIESSPANIVPPYEDPSPPGGNADSDCSAANTLVFAGEIDEDWEAKLPAGFSWVGDICVQLDFTFPTAGNITCSVGDCITLSTTIPTPLPTSTPRPTATFGPSPTPRNTDTPGPTRTITPTSPPAANTNTPPPAANTNTPAPTSPPANTPTPPGPPPTPET